MKNIVEIKTELFGNEETNSVNSRELSEKLGLDRSHYSRWIKNLIDNYDFEENFDYVLLAINGEGLSQTEINAKNTYLISTDMAKEICMLSNSKIGSKIRKYFISRDKQLQQLHQKQIQQKDIQLEIVRKNLSKAINARMKTYKDGFVSLRKYLKERDLILSEEEAWNVIEGLGYIGIEEVQVERRMLVDKNLGRQDGYSGIEFNTKALDLVFSEHIEKSISLFDFIEE